MVAEYFARDPRTGIDGWVHVLDVDLQRRRIGLSARKQPTPDAAPAQQQPRAAGQPPAPAQKGGAPQQKNAGKGFSNNPFADRLKR